MRFIQHKKEAYWFYRVLSPLYDRWVNPLFWTPEMRSAALELARLDEPGLRTVDVGAGTGFSTEGIVEHVEPSSVTLLDQSPDQLRRAARKPRLAGCRTVLGDAERLPFAADAFDRYVSCGSIEYWPEPERAIAEAHRVLRPGGVALVVGPLPPGGRVARRLAEAWMLFPTEAEYRRLFEEAGFEDLETAYVDAPWGRDGGAPYGLAIAGRKPPAAEQAAAEAAGAPVAAGAPAAGAPTAPVAPAEDLNEPLTIARGARFAVRFVLGSLAGAAFVPVGIALHLRARRARRRG
jgi:MPBQ/MSBQ methyltransferase